MSLLDMRFQQSCPHMIPVGPLRPLGHARVLGCHSATVEMSVAYSVPEAYERMMRLVTAEGEQPRWFM
ncbi:MAG TPA: hypothetical protein VFC01_04815 [Mycobacterium sp.]|jgi:hypothetical protein|nr:hypothetical protein [Mycobacterium sp.]